MQSENPFGNYQINKEIGRGRFAIVYDAFDTRLERSVALKIFDDTLLSGNEQFLVRLRQEVETITQLSNAHIVDVFEVGEVDGKFFMAMPLLSGQTLHDKIAAEGPQPLDFVVSAAKTLGKVFDAAHEAGVIHRDIKSSNIMIDEAGNLMILDFGVGTAMVDAGITTHLEVFASPRYIAPELVEGQKASLASDLYSLAVVLYELTTGQTPFVNPSPVGLMRSQVSLFPPHARELRPDVPRPFAIILLKALAKDPTARHKNSQALAKDLARAAGGKILHRQKRAKSKANQSILLWAGLGVLLVLFLGGLRFFAGNNNNLTAAPVANQLTETATLIVITEPAPHTEEPTIQPTVTHTIRPTNTSLSPTKIRFTTTPTPRKTTTIASPTETIASTPNVPQTDEPQLRVLVNLLHFRQGPNTEFGTLGLLEKGDIVTVLGKNEDGSWFNVLTENDRTGWVTNLHTEFVNENTLAKIPIVVTIPALPTVAPTNTPWPTKSTWPTANPTIIKTVRPTNTPWPTNTRRPTNTPLPSNT